MNFIDNPKFETMKESAKELLLDANGNISLVGIEHFNNALEWMEGSDYSLADYKATLMAMINDLLHRLETAESNFTNVCPDCNNSGVIKRNKKTSYCSCFMGNWFKTLNSGQ